MTRSKLQNKNLKSESKKSILGLDDQGHKVRCTKICLNNSTITFVTPKVEKNCDTYLTFYSTF